MRTGFFYNGQLNVNKNNYVDMFNFTNDRWLNMCDKVDKRNATSSWSGYLHQGKVGLFLALKKISELLKNKDDIEENCLKDWYVEYESAEDIDIKNGDMVDSRHQVKAYKDGTTLNSYKKVLDEKKSTAFNILCNNKPGNEITEEHRYLHTIVEVEGFGLSKEDFDKLNEKRKKEKKKELAYVDNPLKIKLYEYPDDRKYCPVDSNTIWYFVKDIIETIRNDISVEKIGNIWWNLKDELDKEISKKHKIGGNAYPILNFDNIYKIVQNCEEYKPLAVNQIRELYAGCAIEFFEELEENCRLIEEERVIVEKIAEEIYKKEDKDFLEFIKTINPDSKDIGKLSEEDLCIKDISKLFNNGGLKDVFYECIRGVQRANFNIGKVGYEEDGGYLLTCINRKISNFGSVVNAIISNIECKNLYEKKHIINGNVNDRFQNICNKVNSINNNYNKDLAEEDKFFTSNCEFITVESAIHKLNNRGDIE